MRITVLEWRNFTAGVRMYKGKNTFFYNGEILWEGDEWDGNPLIYDWEERESWKVIVILPGVEVIPTNTFRCCKNVKTVIMADTVRRIENEAFEECWSLKFVKLSRSLEYIGDLSILGLPPHVQLGEGAFQNTALIKKSPIEEDEDGYYNSNDDDEAIQWVKSINNEEAYALHRACSSFNPLPEIIHALVKRQGIQAMRMPNAIGITPSQYLAANTFADISEKDIINRYILDSMGEVI